MLPSLCKLAVLAAAACVPYVSGLAPTDEYRDADVAQSGYLPNHNMDPAVIDSSQFGQLWKVPFNALEQFYAKPLTYTPLAGGNQLLFLASSQNWIRTLDAKSGAPILSRQVHTPFLQSDIGCTDIPNTIGIIGTPVIDPATDIVYFFAKTYIPNYRYAGATGTFNGVYYFHGVNINTLQDVFPPILIDGAVADNDPRKYFVGGVILQRPSLTQVGSVVYAGFGGHCDLFNYTGLVLGVDINLQKVVTNFVTEAGPLVPQTNVWNENGGGGEGGIWMSGMGLASDGNRLFFVSGNGDGHENVGTPASGSSGCKTLGEVCASLGIGDGGTLSLSDYFQPYDYQNLDGGDLDFGSGGIALLDPTTFTGTGVSKIAVTAGKNGKIYILNANNLGGYKLGPGQTDGIIQTIVTNKAVFGGSGSYPLEGGYLYLTPVGYPTYAYKLGFSGSGVPVFSLAGQTNEVSAGRVGVGIPTITTYQGKEGTAILWMCDPDAGLRAWYAVPGADGTLKRINLPQVNGLNKFQRPAFGDTRLYVTDANGVLYCLGSPVNLPLNCTSPINFGSVALGSKSTTTVSCIANIPITAINGVTVGDAHFVVDSSTLPKGALAAGATFSFPVTWDLTNTTVSNAQNASYGNTSPGIKSTALTLTTTNGIAGYSTVFPISLTGTEVSSKAYLSLTPVNVDFGGVVLLDNQQVPTITLPFVIANAGLNDLTILGYAYTTDELDDDDVDYTNVTQADDGTFTLGEGFSSTNLPAVGSVIASGQEISVDSTFDPITGIGAYQSFLFVYTDGGNQYTALEGSASTAPIANFSISNGEGGWLPMGNLLMDFGQVGPGSTSSRQIRICNEGGSVLEISKSKPPNGIFHIDDPTELHESQTINIGDCAYGTVLFVTNTEQYNIPNIVYSNTWTLNTDDLTFGVHVVEITGVLVSNKVGPQNSTGQPVYEYLGCYSDTDPAGRLLPIQPYVGPQNSNGACQELCYANGYAFEGTEYQTECYCGNRPPIASYLDVDDIYCTFSCSGDPNDQCGGVGGYLSVYYDPTKYTPGGADPVTSGPVTVNVSSNYNYIGCYSEGTNGRALSGKTPAAPTDGFTIELCTAACQGYTYFGMEFGNECYCGNTIGAGSVNQASSDPTVNGCSMFCAGSENEYCGGPNRLDMYQLNGSAPVPPGSPITTPTSGPIIQQTSLNYVYSGCYVDNANGIRALSGLANPESGNGNTVDACASACEGYKYMGVEYGVECYCDNVIEGMNAIAPGGNDPTQNGCSMTCAGNASLYCGGPNRLNVYTIDPNSTYVPPTPTAAPAPTGPVTVGDFAGWSYLGCYSEATNGRALSGLANPISGTAVTIPACAAACSAYAYFGAEYAGECYCGNTINTGSALVAGNTPAQTQCNLACSGNSSMYCGGPNRLNIYSQLNLNIATGPSNGTNGTVTVTTTSAVSTPTGPITVQTVAGGWSYLGCYTEATNTRALNGLQNPGPGSANTVEVCAAACIGYSYFGVEYAGECYCGNTLNTGSTIASGGSNPTLNGCSMACSGNSSEYCGGGNRLNVYHTNSTATSTTATGSATATPTPTGPTTVGNFTGWNYLGCYSEGTNGRALSDLQNPIPAANVSVESCAVACSKYAYFGVEYAQECYCGKSIGAGSVLVAGSTPASTGCNLACAANSTEFCGGGNRLNMYQNTPVINQNILASSNTTTSTAGTSTTSLTTGTLTSTLINSASIPTTSTNSTSTTLPSSIATSSGGTTVLTSNASSSTITSSTTTTTTSAKTVVPTPGQTSASGWAYLGCANETNPRALPAASYASSSNMTVESCQSFCSSSVNNYGLAGLEYAGECYCANGLQSYSALGQTGCNMACTGNSSEICGGSSRLSVYNLTSFVPPTTVKAVGAYVSKGCYNEPSNARLLTGPSYTNATGMTVESCVAYCAAASPAQAYAGVEYSSECYCGSSLPSSAITTDTSSCNTLCTGNKKEFCGAANLLNVYHNEPSSVSTQGNLASMNQPNPATVQANSSTSSRKSKREERRGRARLNLSEDAKI